MQKNYFVLIIALITFSYSLDTSAQWAKVNSPDSTYTIPISVTSLVTNKKNIYARTFDEGIYYSSDGGLNWAHINYPAVNDYYYFFLGTDESHLYVFDSAYGFFSTTDDGANWISLSSSFGSKTPTVTSFVTDNTNIFIGTSSSGIFKSSDKGNTWIAVNNGLPKFRDATDNSLTPIRKIVMADSNIIACTANDGIYISTDMGDNWKPVNDGLPIDSERTSGNNIFYDEIFTLASSGSLILASTTYNGIYRSTDNGTSWAKTNDNLPAFNIVGSFAVKDTLIFALTYNAIYRSNDNGENWELINTGSYNSGGLASFDSKIFVCWYQGIKVSTDDGVSWYSTSNGLAKIKNRYPYQIDSYKSVLAILTAEDYKEFISQDWGRTWVNKSINHTNVDTFAANGANFFKLFGKYYIKTDKENKWKEVYPPYAGFPRRYLYTNDLILLDTVLIAATNKGIWRTGYNNESLIYCCNPQGWTTTLSNVECSSLALESSKIYIGTTDGVYVSNDTGNTWLPLGLENKSISLLFSRGTNFIAKTNTGFYRSYDTGKTWHYFDIGLNNLHDITLCGDTLFAITYIYQYAHQYTNAAIWKRSFNEVMTGVKNEEIPFGFTLEQNYPNPFNPETSIEYTIPLEETLRAMLLNKVTLRIYDLLGREIATLVNEYQQPGKYKVTFSVERLSSTFLSSGIYFYKLTVGNYSQTKKMMFLK